MTRALAVLLLLAGCSDRALQTGGSDPDDGEPVDLSSVDGGPIVDPDLGLLPVDLAIGIDAGPGDQSSPVDAADGFDAGAPADAGSAVGLACGGAVCGGAEACCSTAAGPSCVGLADVAACGTPLLRCDGPEDCPGDRTCIARYFGSPGGTPDFTLCRRRFGDRAIVVCHTSADCEAGQVCTPQMTTVPGMPEIGLCLP